jgi:hypothetical protein
MFSLSTPYDLSTASLSNVSPFSPSHCMAIEFNLTGDLMVYWSNNTMYVYDLSTPYDVSTATLKLSGGGYSGVSYQSATILPASVGRMGVGGRYNYLNWYSFDGGFAGNAKIKMS